MGPEIAQPSACGIHTWDLRVVGVGADSREHLL